MSEPRPSIEAVIAGEIQCREAQVRAAVALLDEGATVPFIARYRKEVTGGLDDTQLRTLEERLRYLRELEERRMAILKSIAEQQKLTPELEDEILAADSKTRLEDLYLPYKPKRRTKAQIAREAGLEPLADALLADPTLEPGGTAQGYLNPEQKIESAKDALDGAKQILMERFAENADLLTRMRTWLWEHALIRSRVAEGKAEEGSKFRDYFDHAEPLAKTPSHRALALFRGRKEGVLRVAMALPDELESAQPHPCEAMVAHSAGWSHRHRAADDWLQETVRWTWRVKLAVQMETELLGRLRELAEADAITVFARNLKALLMAPPAGMRATMGLDPGLRTGVKAVVVDQTGKLLAHTTVFPHAPQKRWDASLAELATLCQRHGVELIAIGNGTASRETDRLAGELLRKLPALRMQKVIVNESGASVYSASELAAREFPGLDVSYRGAVSIARRLQDPLAELVKIDPGSIGVGQYQHDVSQVQLARSLDAVVEDCVNAVGVDVNTASAPLLARIAGLNGTLASNIVAFREEHGAFGSRKALLKVPRLGEKTFEQAAGFLRIMDGKYPLDGSAVHPEAYGVAERIAAKHGRGVKDLIGDAAFLRRLNPADFTCDRFGLPTVQDILGELEKPGRPAPGVPGGRVPRGGRRIEGSEAGDDPRGHGDQCHQLRRLRRHRRAPGRSGAHLGARGPLREGSPRGRRARRHREGEGAGGRPRAQANRAHAASGRGRSPRGGARHGQPGRPAPRSRAQGPGPGLRPARRQAETGNAPQRRHGRALRRGSRRRATQARAIAPRDCSPRNRTRRSARVDLRGPQRGDDHMRLGAAALARSQRDVPAVRLRQLLDDGEPEPTAAGLAAPRAVETVKRSENGFELIARDAGTAVLYPDRHGRSTLERDLDTTAIAVADRVLDQVGEDALQGHRVQRARTGRRGSGPADVFFLAPADVRNDLLDQCHEVDGLDLPVLQVAAQLQGLPDDPVHGPEILADPVDQFRVVLVAQDLQREPHPGQWRAQVVRDAGQQGGPVCEQLTHLSRHPVEVAGQHADLPRPAIGQWGGLLSLGHVGDRCRKQPDPAGGPSGHEHRGQRDQQRGDYQHHQRTVEVSGCDALERQADAQVLAADAQVGPVPLFSQVHLRTQRQVETGTPGQRLLDELQVGKRQAVHRRQRFPGFADAQAVILVEPIVELLARRRRDFGPASRRQQHQCGEVVAGAAGQRHDGEMSHRGEDQQGKGKEGNQQNAGRPKIDRARGKRRQPPHARVPFPSGAKR